MKIKYVIFDLDGTLALINHRKHFVEKPECICSIHVIGRNADCKAHDEFKKDWNSFFEACDKDEPNKPIINLLNQYFNQLTKVVIFSGRSEQVKQKTIDWLAKHEIWHDHLRMRKENDFRPDEILKKEILENFLSENNLTKEDILFVVDDRDKVVKMWRQEGLTCLQVAEGNF